METNSKNYNSLKNSGKILFISVDKSLFII